MAMRQTDVRDAPETDDRGMDDDRRRFVEDFALMWEQLGTPLMDGRVLGYLMMTRAPYSSSADIARSLAASSGSVSTSTRRLVEEGFIKRHLVPGERSHYFRADSDVWGSWLAGERKYLDRQREVIELGLTTVDGADPADEEIRERLVNGRDYMTWLQGHHRKMLAEWEAYKAARDAPPDQEERL